MRVRARGGDYTLTLKSGPSLTRVEEEIEIDVYGGELARGRPRG